jgi:hypothetical protein
MERGKRPPLDTLAKTLEQRRPQSDHRLDRRPRKVSAVRDIQPHSRVFVRYDTALSHQAIEDEPDPAVASDTREPVHFAPRS